MTSRKYFTCLSRSRSGHQLGAAAWRLATCASPNPARMATTITRMRLSMAFSGRKCLAWQMASSSDFYEIIAAVPNVATGISFAEYMQLAKYHPTAGYYTRDAKRVGRDENADFSTSTSFNPFFGELVVDAAVQLIAPIPPSELHFVEIGAETYGGILRNIARRFASYRTI